MERRLEENRYERELQKLMEENKNLRSEVSVLQDRLECVIERNGNPVAVASRIIDSYVIYDEGKTDGNLRVSKGTLSCLRLIAKCLDFYCCQVDGSE